MKLKKITNRRLPTGTPAAPPLPQEERNYILQMVKKIKASGANVVLVQKSILRDAVPDLSLHYLVGGWAVAALPGGWVGCRCTPGGWAGGWVAHGLHACVTPMHARISSP